MNIMNPTNPRTPTTAIHLSSPIEEKIAWARTWEEKFGKALLEESRITDLLRRLKAATDASRLEMVKTGVAEVCRRCDQEEGGSCCGVGIENRYDGWLLLINLLLGVILPSQRARPDACYFWGDQGCVLMARHILCINYLCKNVTDQIDPSRIATLREKEGAEADALFLLHERIKAVLNPWISDSGKPLQR